MAKERSTKKQLLLNLSSTAMSYVLTFGISFFLTPYIIKKLGVAAYGFIGLSNNIISYTALLTVALNSMSGRFVSLNYHKGLIDEANRYLSSTFFANTAIAGFIVVLLSIFTFFLESILNIPPELVLDVKILFAFLFINAAIGLTSGFLSFSTFIKNRLELTNIRGMIGNIIRAVLLVVLFGCFPAHIWYMGLAGIICTIYYVSTNFHFYRTLTPDLEIKTEFFHFGRVVEMVKAGAWNLLNSVSSILNQGYELLLANLFISAYYMGILSVSKTLPLVILGFFTSLSQNFHPEYIKLYANGNKEMLIGALTKSIRVIGAVAAIPCAIVFAYGDIFYTSWIPQQNISVIYTITCISMAGLLCTIPPQSLWYIFTMTNTVKKSSINCLEYAILNFGIVLTSMFFIQNNYHKLIIIVSVQAVLYAIRYLTFLPIYGAEVLKIPKYLLLKTTLKMLLLTGVLAAISIAIKIFFINSYSWKSFFGASALTAAIGLPLAYIFALTPSDRVYVNSKIKASLGKIL